jgi:hypothetical protein
VDDLYLHRRETTRRSNGETGSEEYGRSVSETREPCWMCGSPASVFRFDCPECRRRWEDIECSELRERLFPVEVPPALTE